MFCFQIDEGVDGGLPMKKAIERRRGPIRVPSTEREKCA